MSTTHTTRSTVVGVFEDRRLAQQAVDELKRAGFTDDQIGVASRATDEEGRTRRETEEGSYAEEGAVAGAVAGAGIGGLWALGIAAGVLPVIGPVIAGGLLASILASAAAGAAVGGLAGALIGLGVPEEEAHYYETEFKAGRTIVTVKANGRYDEARDILRRNGAFDRADRFERTGERIEEHRTGAFATEREGVHTGTFGTEREHAHTGTTGERVIQAREEELEVHKRPVETGEVRVHKDVVVEHKTVDVPVEREEVVVERRPVAGHEVSGTDIREGEEVRIPVREEEVHVEKHPVVKEEVAIGKRTVQDTERVSEELRKEEIDVEKRGDVDVRDKR